MYERVGRLHQCVINCATLGLTWQPLLAGKLFSKLTSSFCFVLLSQQSTVTCWLEGYSFTGWSCNVLCLAHFSKLSVSLTASSLQFYGNVGCRQASVRTARLELTKSVLTCVCFLTNRQDRVETLQRVYDTVSVMVNGMVNDRVSGMVNDRVNDGEWHGEWHGE